MRTRFAPSPTGPLHLGHAFSALTVHDMARAAQGSFLLRIEDIDQSRARPEWEARIYDDLHWLGIDWAEPPLRQSDNMAAYDAALDVLWSRGLLYRCDCNRRDIAAAASAPQEGASLIGPDGIVYPGTCRAKHPRTGPRPTGAALRIDMTLACQDIETLTYSELNTVHVATTTADMIARIGDVVIARRDMGTSYHLSVVVDDAAQSITHVVRGKDLAGATPIHRLLQRLLSLPEPLYHHHRLIRDASGKRLAKRDDARAIARYRAEGATPADIRTRIGL